MSVPIDPTAGDDPVAESLGESPDLLRWHGLGLSTQVALSWLVAHPGEVPNASDVASLRWMRDHGYAYARRTKDRGDIYFATLAATRIYRNATGQ